MREILFRGKRIDNGEWVEGGLISVNDCEHGTVTAIIPHNCEAYRFNISGEYVIPETIGQYTGKTDKNGKKIFEGDVVDILTENEEAGIVTYDEGCFHVKADGFSIDFRNNINGDDLLIIGNIHDNCDIFICNNAYNYDLFGFENCGNFISAADAVEVVRCSECKYFGKELKQSKHSCLNYQLPYCLENDYCSYGERKDGDEE